MADIERDPDRRARVAAIVDAIKRATDDQMIGDVQMAIGNIVAQMSLGAPNPEVTVLATIEIISEIYRGARALQLDGKDPQGVIN